MASPCHNIHHLCYSITIITSTITIIVSTIALSFKQYIANANENIITKCHPYPKGELLLSGNQTDFFHFCSGS